MLSGICRSFLVYDLPHRWRQIDTLSVSIRYWLRWTIEAHPLAPLLPAVLRSEDGYGIMPMEFPLLNLLTAPFFSAGPQAGFVLANSFVFVTNVVLTLCCAYLWKRKKLYDKIRMDYVCLSLMLFTLSSRYLFKFMPDYASLLLVFWGLSGAWTRGWKLGACILMTLGLLMKPTSVIALAFVFWHPDFKGFIKKNAAWVFLSLVVAASYYTLGLHYIDQFRDTAQIFLVRARNPLTNLGEAFSYPEELLKLLFQKLLFAPGVFLFFGLSGFVLPMHKRFLAKGLVILALQILGIFVLDGSHAYNHDYYFIGCAPNLAFLCFGCFYALQDFPERWKRYALVLTFLLTSLSFFDQIYFETRALFPKTAERYLQIADCQALKAQHPEIPWNSGYVFRSANSDRVPQAGVCFFEREGSTTSRYGIQSQYDPIPEDCKKLDQKGNALIVICYN